MGCYDLKWESHPSETLKFMSELRNRSIFVDLSLFCGNRVFPVHRVIVAAASGYLNRVLRLTNNSPHDSSDPRGRNIVIALPPSIKPELLALAVEFMYSGEISLDSGDLEEFMRVSDALEIRGLRRGSGTSSDPPLKRPKLTETQPLSTPTPSLRTPTPHTPAPADGRPQSVESRTEKPEKSDRPAIPELKSLKTEQPTEENEEENFDEVGPETDDETDRRPVKNQDEGSQPVLPGPSHGSGPLVKVGSFLWRGTMVGTGIPFYSCDKCSYTTLHPEKGLRHDLLHLNAIAMAVTKSPSST